MMKVKIYNDPVRHRLNIVFYEKTDGVRYVAKPVELVMETQEPGVAVEPTLCIDGQIADEFLAALAEELDNKGIKTDKDAKIAGTLEATRFHLSDLRNLLKLPKK